MKFCGIAGRSARLSAKKKKCCPLDLWYHSDSDSPAVAEICTAAQTECRPHNLEVVSLSPAVAVHFSVLIFFLQTINTISKMHEN